MCEMVGRADVSKLRNGLHTLRVAVLRPRERVYLFFDERDLRLDLTRDFFFERDTWVVFVRRDDERRRAPSLSNAPEMTISSDRNMVSMRLYLIIDKGTQKNEAVPFGHSLINYELR